MFYQGAQTSQYGQINQPSFQQQPQYGYNAPPAAPSGGSILEFPSPYGAPLYGGYPQPAPPDNTYGAMPHFAPQQPTSLPPQAQQPAPAKQPLFQPSGMIRSRKPVSMSAPVETVPSYNSGAGMAPSSPMPPLAASVSLPVVPSVPHDSDDFPNASAPPAYHYSPYSAMPGQPIYGQDYTMAAPPAYKQQPPQQPDPTPYHHMPPPLHRYPSAPASSFPLECVSHTPQFPSAPPPHYQAIPSQQYQPVAPLHQQHQQQQQQQQQQPQLQASAQLQAPAQAQQQQQQQSSVAAPSASQQTSTAQKKGSKALPQLPEQASQGHQRVASSSDELTNELEAKLRERDNKPKNRNTINLSLPQNQMANLSLNASSPVNPLRRHSMQSSSTTTTTPTPTLNPSSPAPAAAEARPTVHEEYIYATPDDFVLKAESKRPLPSAAPPVGEDYHDISSVHDVKTRNKAKANEDDDDSSDSDSEAEAEAEAGYVAGVGETNYLDLSVSGSATQGSNTQLPPGYIQPSSINKRIAQSAHKLNPPDEASAKESSEKKALRQSTSAKRGNRWEIEFDELEIDKRIGQGAYGSVYKGKWRNTVVAIKTIRENMASFHEAKFKEFRDEAALMMDMRPHTNVLQLFGVCMRPYMAIVVEYLEGGSLQELLQSKAELDLHMALKIALHAAAGVAHLHTEGVCHRDLAARNLLLTSRNKDYLVVKVADFGLARFTEAYEDNFTSCKVGPLKWMPPESLQQQKYSHRSDSWAMGVVLWEIFSRQDPFPGISPVQVAIGVSSGGLCLRPPSLCPPEIEQLMYDCWEFDPKDRPDFRTIVRTIEHVIDSNPKNYPIVSNTGESLTCTHPKRKGSGGGSFSLS